jgi:Zn-dependent protease with chaperone function
MTGPALARSAGSVAAAQSGERGVEQAPEQYKLTPEKRQQALAYSRERYVLYFVGVGFALGIYFLLWRSGLAQWFRNIAQRASGRHFLQCLIFVPIFCAVAALLELPLDYYSGFVLEHRFGLSTQGFASWLFDWGKNFALSTAMMVFLIWILYAIIRRSPQHWWFYFWLVTIPVTLGIILLQPLVVDPLFFKFTPLENSRPELVEEIEQMLGRAELQIPSTRIFEMNASSKTNAIDAYVTGLGASKRVVIWDTTLEKMSPDEILLVVGHETGHYALEHIPKEFALIQMVALVFIVAGFIAVTRMIRRWGPRTGLEGAGDLASLPLMFLILTAMYFLSSPAICAISRYYEHQADQYGLEVSYGVVKDPNAAEARALQVLGEGDLADPAPSPFIKFWLYSHPPLSERIQFALSYKPWAEGKPLELVRPGR